MSNQLINKFKTIDLSRRRLENILKEKGIEPSANSLSALVEEVTALNVPDYTPEDWTGVTPEEMPDDYYVPEIDFEAIYNADTDKANYTNVVMYLIDCTDHDFNLIQNVFQSFQKYKFSDTNTLVNPAKNTESPAHNWDKTRDIIGDSGRHYRWVMGYSNTQNLNVDYQNYMILDAIIVFKGSYGNFSIRDGNNLPRYLEIKQNVSNINPTGGDSIYNDTLRTVICNAPTAHLNDGVFRGCTKLYVVNWNSISNTNAHWTFTDCSGLRWLYIKQNTAMLNGTFQRMHNCYIQIDKLTGFFGTTSSYANDWTIMDTDNLRIKIEECNSLGKLCGVRIDRSGYFDIGDNFLEIDLIKGGSIYDNMNDNKWPKTRIHEINNCSISASAFRFTNYLYPEIKITGNCTINQGDNNSRTFEGNNSIRRVDMSEATIPYFYNFIFNECFSLEELRLPKGLTHLPYYMLYHTKIKNLVIPDSVTTLDSNCFRGAEELESISLGNGITTLPAWIFAGLDKLTNIIIPDGVTLIDTVAFLDTTRLESIVIPQAVKRIGVQAFKNSGIQSIEIQGTNVIVNSRAFMDCTNLSTIDLSNVTQIDEYAFENTAFDILVIPANGGVFNDNAFVYTNAKSIIFEEGFEPTKNINISYSDITKDTVLDTLYSLPDLTGKTGRTLTIGATCEIPITTAGYTFYDTIKNKSISETQEGLVWDETGPLTVAQYVASKNWAIV